MAHWTEKGLDWLHARGVNVTRLRWRLYQMQRKAEAAKDGPKLPASLQWMAYQHKKCIRCGAINAHDERRCTECGARMPSMGVYRAMRLLGLTTPSTNPVVVSAFIGVIALVFALMVGMQGLEGLMRPSRYTLLTFGAYAPILSHLPLDVWRMLGFGIVHGGIIHIAFNGFALSQVGPIIESQLGRARMIALITLTQLTAAAATYVWYGMVNNGWMQLTVGASGWLFGLIGFGIVFFRGAMGPAAMYRSTLIQWAVYGAVFGLLMGANNAAHAGGFLGGAAFALLPLSARMRSRRLETGWLAAGGVCAALWLVALGFLAYSVISGWSPGGMPPE